MGQVKEAVPTMTPDTSPTALARLRERLDARCAFGMNGATWMILRAPDPDCAEASAAILALEKRATAVEARLLEIAKIAGDADKRGWADFDRIAAIARSKPAEGEPKP